MKAVSLHQLFVNEWLEQVSLLHKQQRQQRLPMIPRINKRKINRVRLLKHKVHRLATDNQQLRQCSDELERQQTGLADQTAAKEARVAALEQELQRMQQLLLLQQQQEQQQQGVIEPIVQ